MNTKNAGEIAEKVSKNGSRTQLGRKADDEEKLKINAIFELFQIAYPFWNHGLEADQVTAKKYLWMAKLHFIDNDVCLNASERCPITFPDKSGPTIGEFLKLCRVEPAHQEFQHRLPAPQNDSIAEAEIKKMKENLGMNLKKK